MVAGSRGAHEPGRPHAADRHRPVCGARARRGDRGGTVRPPGQGEPALVRFQQLATRERARAGARQKPAPDQHRQFPRLGRARADQRAPRAGQYHRLQRGRRRPHQSPGRDCRRGRRRALALCRAPDNRAAAVRAPRGEVPLFLRGHEPRAALAGPRHASEHRLEHASRRAVPRGALVRHHAVTDRHRSAARGPGR